MDCKNCQDILEEDALFCHKCGAKVIRNRITLKLLITEVFVTFFGWDNKYFVTVKRLVIQPDIVLEEYLAGVRKKYVNPIAFFAIGAAISLFTFNFFAEEYIEINKNQSTSVSSLTQKMTPNYDKFSPEKKANLLKDQEENQEKSLRFMLKYFNLFAFILLPFYALLAYWTYRKPYNYGEHVVINSYIQGITFLTTNLFFILAVFINPNFFLFGVLITVSYYLYAYKKLYKLSFGKTIITLLKFIGILIASLIAIMILGVILGVAFIFLKKKVFNF